VQYCAAGDGARTSLRAPPALPDLPRPRQALIRRWGIDLAGVHERFPRPAVGGRIRALRQVRKTSPPGVQVRMAV